MRARSEPSTELTFYPLKHCCSRDCDGKPTVGIIRTLALYLNLTSSTQIAKHDSVMKKFDVDPIVVRAAVGVAAASVVGGALIYATNRRRRLAVPRSGPYPAESLPEGAYDAIIVGGGPSGSTCAHYLAKAGAKVR